MISILIALYNGYEYLDESIQSVISQTYTEWELLIGVNGHSLNSDIYKLAKEYENDKIKVYDLNVQGKSNALNELIKYCKYDYIAILDVDDIWLPYKLQYQVMYIDTYDVVGSNCIYFGMLNNNPGIPMYDISQFDMRICNPIINSSAIIKKELCYWNGNILEDYDLWIRLRKLNKKFYNCPDVLVKHRIYLESEFNSKTTNEDIRNLMNKHYLI